MVSWNARALLAGVGKLRAKKLEVFKKLTARYNVVMIQEMHGNTSEVKHVFRHLAASHWICVSEGADSATGGVTTFVQKAKFPNHILEKVFELPGRALSVRISSISGPPSELVLINIHDESPAPQAKAKMEKHVRNVGKRVGPFANAWGAFIAGDFNFVRAGETRLELARPLSCGEPSRGSAFWGRALQGFTEIDARQFTRYDAASDSLTSLDFIFSAAPPSQLAQLH